MISILEICECGTEFPRGIYPQQKCEICDIKTFNEIWCGGLNDVCDSHYEPEIKDTEDEDNRFFGTHIREVVKTFKEMRKSGK